MRASLVTTPSATQMQMTSCDKRAVGQLAAMTRKVRPPEPYNGKGIRYHDEQVRRKVGKSIAGAGA